MHFVNKGKKMRRKQLSWMSSGKVVRRPPRGTVFEDGVEDREQFSHASHQSHLLRFAVRNQTSEGSSSGWFLLRYSSSCSA